MCPGGQIYVGSFEKICVSRATQVVAVKSTSERRAVDAPDRVRLHSSPQARGSPAREW
jgi:hypothetical protein